MVDEVEITNVGGKGVASEVTLKQLKETFDSMAKAKGIDTKRTQTGLDNLTKKLKGSSEELGIFGKAAESAADSLKKFPEKAFDALTGSITGLANELASGSRDISDFAQHMPIMGNAMSRVTGIVDDSFNAFQSLATSGATFGNSLGELRSQAAGAGLTLQEYSQVIGNNTENLAQFGGTVERGARSTAQMMDALGSQRAELQALGVTQEELNESLIFYQTITRSGARAENRSRLDQANAAASLTKNMLTLSKLTGDDVKAQQEKIAQAQMDVAFQREMNRLSADEQAKLNTAMLEAQQTGGKVAVDALKAEFLGMPPLTEELQIYTATQQESAGLIRESVRAVRNEAISSADFMAGQEGRLINLAEAAARMQEQNEELLTVGAAGGDGVAAMIAEQSMTGMEYINTFLTEEAGKLVVDVDALRASIREAGDLEPGEEQQAMGKFRDSLMTTRKTLVDNVINPLVENDLAPALSTLTGKMNDLANSEIFQDATTAVGENFFKTAGIAITGFFAGKAATSALTKGLTSLLSNKSAPTKGPSTSRSTPSGIRSDQGSVDSDEDNKGRKKGGRLGRFARGAGRFLGRAAAPLAIGAGIFDIGKTLQDDELSGSEKGEQVSGTTGGVAGGLTGAKLGATLGAIGGPLGIAAGGLVGGGVGYLAGSSFGKGVGNFLFGGDSDDGAEEQQRQDVATAQQASQVSDDQMARLEKLVGFTPQVNTLTESIGTFQQKFNNLDLDYRDIDRSTRSFEKMAEQLEEINNQLDGDKGFFEKLNPFSNSEDNPTARDAISQSGLNDSEQMQQLNRTLNDILAVLVASNDMNKKQLNAARAASGNLFASF